MPNGYGSTGCGYVGDFFEDHTHDSAEDDSWAASEAASEDFDKVMSNALSVVSPGGGKDYEYVFAPAIDFEQLREEVREAEMMILGKLTSLETLSEGETPHVLKAKLRSIMADLESAKSTSAVQEEPASDLQEITTAEAEVLLLQAMQKAEESVLVQCSAVVSRARQPVLDLRIEVDALREALAQAAQGGHVGNKAGRCIGEGLERSESVVPAIDNVDVNAREELFLVKELLRSHREELQEALEQTVQLQQCNRDLVATKMEQDVKLAQAQSEIETGRRAIAALRAEVQRLRALRQNGFPEERLTFDAVDHFETTARSVSNYHHISTSRIDQLSHRRVPGAPRECPCVRGQRDRDALAQLLSTNRSKLHALQHEFAVLQDFETDAG